MADTDGEPEVSANVHHEDSQHEAPPTAPAHVDHGGAIAELKEQINKLQQQIDDIVFKGETDTQPTKLPWTHRGF